MLASLFYSLIVLTAFLSNEIHNIYFPPSASTRERIDLLILRANLKRFPSPKTCNYWIARSSRHLDWIDERMRLFPYNREAWTLYRQQVVEWGAVWHALRTCQTNSTIAEDGVRFQWIRRTIGEENYRRGFVPPPIASYLLDLSPQSANGIR